MSRWESGAALRKLDVFSGRAGRHVDGSAGRMRIENFPKCYTSIQLIRTGGVSSIKSPQLSLSN